MSTRSSFPRTSRAHASPGFPSLHPRGAYSLRGLYLQRVPQAGPLGHQDCEHPQMCTDECMPKLKNMRTIMCKERRAYTVCRQKCGLIPQLCPHAFLDLLTPNSKTPQRRTWLYLLSQEPQREVAADQVWGKTLYSQPQLQALLAWGRTVEDFGVQDGPCLKRGGLRARACRLQEGRRDGGGPGLRFLGERRHCEALPSASSAPVVPVPFCFPVGGPHKLYWVLILEKVALHLRAGFYLVPQRISLINLGPQRFPHGQGERGSCVFSSI